MGPKNELHSILGEQWKKGLRRLRPQQLTRAAQALARAPKAPPNSGFGSGSAADNAAWSEQRRQRLAAVLQCLELHEQGAPSLPARDWAALLWSVAKCRGTVPDLIARGSRMTLQDESSMTSTDAAKLLWSAATLKWEDQALLQGIVGNRDSVLQGCTLQDLSNMVWASAILGKQEEAYRFGLEAAEVFTAQATAASSSAARSTSEPAPRASAQAVANVLWALAKLKDHKATTPAEDQRFADLARRMSPLVINTLLEATPQGISNIMWACAKLDAREDQMLGSCCHRLAACLEAADMQHIANGCWATARLMALAPSSDGFTALETEQAAKTLLRAVAKHLHERVQTGVDGRFSRKLMLRRWAGCSTKHVSMFCWSFAKALPKDKATRQVLRDSLDQVEELSDQNDLRAQEHSNILWAWSAGIDAWLPSERPKTVLKRLIAVMCRPNMQLKESTPLAAVMSCVALSKLHGVVDEGSQKQLAAWMDRTSRLAVQTQSLSELRGSSVVALLRSMTNVGCLHSRLLHEGLKVLRGDDVASTLQPFEYVLLLESTAFVRPEKVPSALVDILGEAVARLNEFHVRDIARMLWVLLRLSHFSSSAKLDFEAVFSACTQALGNRNHPLSLTSGAPPNGPRLTPMEWVWFLNTAAPLKLSEGRAVEGPSWLLTREVAPWQERLETYCAAVRGEVSALSGSRAQRTEETQQAASWRYQKALREIGVESLGPRWTPLALSLLQIGYCQPTSEVLSAFEEERSRRKDEGRFGHYAMINVKLEGHAEASHSAWDEGEGYSTEDNDESTRGSESDSDANEDDDDDDDDDNDDPRAPRERRHDSSSNTNSSSSSSSSSNSSSRSKNDSSNHEEGMPFDETFGGSSSSSHSAATNELKPWTPLFLKGRRNAGRAESQLLRRLASELEEVSPNIEGSILLFADRAPDISSLGALAQLRQRFPRLEVKVCYENGLPGEVKQADPSEAPFEVVGGGPNANEDSELLAKTIREALEKYTREKDDFVPVSVIGSYSDVQELWKKVSGGLHIQPSKKKEERKKKKWTDKLKYFLTHRPHDFDVRQSEPVSVRILNEPSDEALGHAKRMDRLQLLVERAIVRLMKTGRGKSFPQGEGFVPIEEVTTDKEVSAIWKHCKLDASHRLAFYLRHSQDFEVLDKTETSLDEATKNSAPPASSNASDASPIDARTWVRIRL